ncbi:unnamed protein product [Rotaria magnacalcarata]|uniref:Protein JTB n=2 Tax=Rotaria magnacalcarata TaxID=392030 RepID=A0A817APB6_9BILA|nr:unnamed protein product [Rotaria magnacalcarata]
MLDFVTRRRLIFGAVALLFVTISVLFIAHLNSTLFDRGILSSYTLYSANSSLNNEQQSNECYLTEAIEVKVFCQKCTSYERRSKANGCSPTGYKELVLCSKSNIKASRSCPVPIRIQKENFWIFQGIVLFIGLLSMASVHGRQKALDKQMVEKIKRQIGDSDN